MYELTGRDAAKQLDSVVVEDRGMCGTTYFLSYRSDTPSHGCALSAHGKSGRLPVIWILCLMRETDEEQGFCSDMADDLGLCHI